MQTINEKQPTRMNSNAESRINRLDNQLSSLLEELKDYSEQSLNKKPAEDKWSIMQVMHHLILAEGYAQGYAQGYVKKKLSFNPQLKKAGLKAWWNKFLVKTYLTLPFKVNAPDAVGTVSLPEHSNFWETAKEWKQKRLELRELFEGFPNDIYDKELYKHPMSGKMTMIGMLEFYEVHFNRHRKQIDKILTKSFKIK